MTPCVTPLINFFVVCRSAEYEQQINETASQRDRLENSLKDLQNELTQEKIDKEKLNSQMEQMHSAVKHIANCDSLDRSVLLDPEALLMHLAQNPQLITNLNEKHKGIAEVRFCP